MLPPTCPLFMRSHRAVIFPSVFSLSLGVWDNVAQSGPSWRSFHYFPIKNKFFSVKVNKKKDLPLSLCGASGLAALAFCLWLRNSACGLVAPGISSYCHAFCHTVVLPVAQDFACGLAAPGFLSYCHASCHTVVFACGSGILPVA